MELDDNAHQCEGCGKKISLNAIYDFNREKLCYDCYYEQDKELGGENGFDSG